MNILIKNAHILTFVDGHEWKPIKGDILIQGDKISQIGDVDFNHIAEETEVIHAEGMVAMPGLINAHNHTPMSLLRSFSDDLKLMDWLKKKIIPAENKMTGEDIYWGALLSIAELIKSGTTTFADMYIQMDYIAEAVKDSGIRASLARGLVFHDDDGGKRIQEGMDLIEKWSGGADGRISTMLGPHAPFTCPPEPLKEIIDLARNKNIPIHIHLAETKEEVEIIQKKYNKTPTQYLYDLGLFDGSIHALLAHAVHLNDEDIKLIRGNKGGISHNPTSNLKLGCGIAPVISYLQNGITVALGTDGAGSASNQDLFKEINLASGLQKVQYFEPSVLDAKTVLRMATVGGSKVLNLDREVGTIEVGKKADIILLDFNKPHLVPQHNLISLLAYSATGADVDTTIVNGKVLMRNRVLQTIDEELLLNEARKRAKRIVEEI